MPPPVDRDVEGRPTTMAPAVSFLCPAYRTEATLAETLDSVLAQIDPDWEVVVCDNGRSDEIARIVGCYARADDRVRLVRQENRGLGGGVDAAAAVARGRYVTVLPTDDLVEPGFVGRLRTVLDECPGIDAVVGDAVDIDDAGNRRARTLGERARLPRRAHRLTLPDLVLGRVPYYGGLVRRGVWDAVGGFGTDDPGPPDLALWLRLVHRHTVLVVPEVHARIRFRPDSLSRAASEQEAFEAGVEAAIERAVGLSDDPAAHADLARGLRRLRYLRAVRRARWAFADRDLGRARREAREAVRQRPTPRALGILIGLSLAPGVLRSVQPVKASLTGAVSRTVAARRAAGRG